MSIFFLPSFFPPSLPPFLPSFLYLVNRSTYLVSSVILLVLRMWILMWLIDIYHLPQFTLCVELYPSTFGVTTLYLVSDNPPSATLQLTSCNPSDTHFHKQISGLSQGKVPYLLWYLLLSHLVCVKLCLFFSHKRSGFYCIILHRILGWVFLLCKSIIFIVKYFVSTFLIHLEFIFVYG